MFTEIKNHCDELIKQFDSITPERKILLVKIANYIQNKKSQNLPINLIYVCTHNSRRSHFGQVWSAVASNYYKINNVNSFSGGTEVTAFNPNTIQALVSQGFKMDKLDDSTNPNYHVYFGENEFTSCFSKTYNNSTNPKNDFVAIMTCSEAEENCPLVEGAEMRISTTYEDPKEFDDTALQNLKYMERSSQIGLETLYIFSLIK